MKKIVLLALLIFGYSQIYSQELPVRLGFQASPTISWMSTNDNTVNGAGARLGLKFGLMAEKYFDAEEKYSLTSGLALLVNHGGTLNHEVGGNFFPTSELSDSTYYNLPANVDVGYNIQFLEIPIGIKLRTKEFGYLRYYGEIPFLVHIRTQARGKFTDTSKERITPDVGLLNVSWGIGGGAEYTIAGRTAATAGLYFHNGLFDMTANRDTELSSGGEEDSKAIISALTIRLGIMF